MTFDDAVQDDMLIWTAFNLVDLKSFLGVLIFSDFFGEVELEVLQVQPNLGDPTVRDELLALFSKELISSHLHCDEPFVWLLLFGILWVKSLHCQLLVGLAFTE